MGSRHPLKTTSGIIYEEKSYWTRHPWKKYNGSDLDLSVDERVGSAVLSGPPGSGPPGFNCLIC